MQVCSARGHDQQEAMTSLKTIALLNPRLQKHLISTELFTNLYSSYHETIFYLSFVIVASSYDPNHHWIWRYKYRYHISFLIFLIWYFLFQFLYTFHNLNLFLKQEIIVLSFLCTLTELRQLWSHAIYI